MWNNNHGHLVPVHIEFIQLEEAFEHGLPRKCIFVAKNKKAKGSENERPTKFVTGQNP
jgi:hypothetical protein